MKIKVQFSETVQTFRPDMLESDQTFEVDYKDLLLFIQMIKGDPGKDGKDGYTPVKGVDYFDGLPGKDGKDGSDGKDGANGKSGVYVGSGDMPEGYNVQIDPDGEPIDINKIVSEAIFKPWKKLGEYTFSEDGTPMTITFDNLGGMTEFMFKIEGLTNGTTNSGMSVVIDGYYVKSQVIPTTANANNYCYVELKFNGLYWKFTRTGASNSKTNWVTAAEQTPYNIELVDGLAPAQKMQIIQHGVYYAKAGTLIVYGR